MRPQQRDVAAAIVQRHHLTVDPRLERTGAAAGANMLAHQGVVRIHGHVANGLGFRVARHLEHQGIVGVEHRAVGGDLDDDAFQFAQLLERIDAFQSQMIGLHIEHRADIHFGDAHAGAQQSAARGFQHGDIDLRIRQHHAGGHRTGHIALHGALAIDVHAIGGRQSRRVACPSW